MHNASWGTSQLDCHYFLQGVYDQLKKRLQFPDGFLPGQDPPRTSHANVPDTPVVALIDSSSHEGIGPVAITSFKKYLGNDQVCPVPQKAAANQASLLHQKLCRFELSAGILPTDTLAVQ